MDVRSDKEAKERSEKNILEGQQEWCKRSMELQKQRLRWYGDVMMMVKDEHIVRRIVDVDMPRKR